MKPRFFARPEDFRAWLAENHASAPELLVGFHKKGCGKPSIDWPQSVDEALCFGWIDGVRRSLGEESYTIRFTPRRPGSTWSSINIRRVAVLRQSPCYIGVRKREPRLLARVDSFLAQARSTQALMVNAMHWFKHSLSPDMFLG